MLNIITGRTGSCKTRYIRNLATEIAKVESDSVVMIVPEQFSFDTEKALLELLGNEKYNNVENTSFSRLADKLLNSYGKITKPIADDATRTVLMSMAIDELQDKITFYGRYRKNPSLLNELLSFNRELKKCQISVNDLANASISKPTFKRKIEELSYIFTLYETLLNKSFQDDAVLLDMLEELLVDVHYFKDKTVFIDAFTGFSKQELNIIKRILVDARDVYVTLCYDPTKNNEEYELFYNSRLAIKDLENVTKLANVKIAPKVHLTPDRAYKNEELNILEENLFDYSNSQYKGECDCISIVPCKSMVEECDFVASEIKRLVRKEGYRYRDIAVIERTNGDYKNQLLSSFRKYDIDCFNDSRQPVLSQPLMAFMLSLFDILGEGFQNEMVLRFLKTGLFGFTIEEIATIEDYILMWNIRASEWKKEWTNNPDGFGKEFLESSSKQLEKLNKLRERIVAPILSLQNKITNTNGETISRELFVFLRSTNVDKNLKKFTSELLDNNETDLALEQGRIWKILMDILDNLCSAIGQENITLQRYRELFEIIVSTKDLGQIPNGIDEVILGSADRIRATAPKAVFIVGANTDVFPKMSDCGVVLSDSERCELKNMGFDFVSNLEYNSISEKFIAYHAMTLATDKLYVSYSVLNNKAENMTKSELVYELQRIFKKVKELEITSEMLIESRTSAFSILAKEKDTDIGAAISNFFENNNFSNELSMIKKIDKKSFEIKDKDLAVDLFKKDMYLSASKTETYYNCPFQYFCKFGLNLYPRKEAELTSTEVGTFVHEILEKLLNNNDKKKLIAMTEYELEEQINKFVDEYVEEKLSGYSDKPVDFSRKILIVKENVFKIALQLIYEFSQSEFVPVDFELSIDNDGDILPYLLKLDDGGSVKIKGKVDRVDAYYKNEEAYIRVIDYKTYLKKFELYEVFEGINTQMLIYLFAIWQNGTSKYGNVVPSGVLYFPAKNKRIGNSNVTRYDNSEKVEKEIHKTFKMNGMVLNNSEIITAMEKDAMGILIPAKISSKGNISGNVISLFALNKLKNRIDDLVKNMATELHNGNIIAKPIEEGCKYCDYKSVCGHEEQDTIREMRELSFDDAIDELGR